MTPQEKDLILSVFDRLARAGAGPRDAEAEALINQRIVQQPDAVYGLVQAVLIQEMHLNQAQQHISALENQLAQARAGAPAQGGSFLGGAAPAFGGSVPNSGAAWAGQPAAQPQPQYAAQPQYAPQPQLQAQPQPQPGFFQRPAAGGGFLRNAASMAAGVAGGTLLAEGIASLFGGHRGFGGGFGGMGGIGGSPWGGQPTEVVENITNNYYGDQPDQNQDMGQNAGWSQDGGQDSSWGGDNGDAGYQDASFDDMSGGYDDSQDF